MSCLRNVETVKPELKYVVKTRNAHGISVNIIDLDDLLQKGEENNAR